MSGAEVAPEIREMEGTSALPRSNGRLTFDAPWQGRVLGVAIVAVDQLGVEWDAFRLRLIDAIAEAPDRPYYESWTAALESLVLDLGVATREDLDRRAAAVR